MELRSEEPAARYDGLAALAQSEQDSAVSTRRLLHISPELRYDTTATRRYIWKHLELMGLAVNESRGGLVADIDLCPGADRFLFRADFDALPIQEETGLAFTSKKRGVSHACGHDAHVAMLLGFLSLVEQGKVQAKHNLRVVFQDAEENPGSEPDPVSGGDRLVRDGVLDGVSEAYGLHIWNNPEPGLGEPGVFYSRPGSFLANSGRMSFEVKSSGGHVAMPHKGVNALDVYHEIVSRLNMFRARFIDPNEPATLVQSAVKAGDINVLNVMPSVARFGIGFRTYMRGDEHARFMGRIEEEVEDVAASMGATVTTIKKVPGHPALINDEHCFHRVSCMLQGAGQKVVVHPRIAGGEDFAHYLSAAPGGFWMLGAYKPGTTDHHSPRFDFDESVLWKGVLFWLLLATS